MIAFVLTISHIVYLTASWQRQTREGTTDPVKAAIRYVGLVSVWSLAANLLGFASLLFVSAKPLRQFGMSGVIAAVLAIICAYLICPALRHRCARRTGQMVFTTGLRSEPILLLPHKIVEADSARKHLLRR